MLTTRRIAFTVLALFALAAAPASASVFVSDDFSSANLDPAIWTFVDPVGGGAASLANGELSIAVPAGTEHDIWYSGNMSVRLMQPTDNVDFEIEVKYASVPSQRFQLQGVLVEQNAQNFMRFDFYSDGQYLWLFAARFVNGSPTIMYNGIIGTPSGGDLYMRIARAGNLWTQSWSNNGTSWTQSTSFSHVLVANRVGPFAGNAGPSPAFTGIVDYFFNTAAPIDPEDGGSGPDTTPPNFFNEKILIISETEIAASWTTDEPADGFVEYGLTTNYELGSLSDAALSTDHSFSISGLQPDTTYQVRFSSTDAASNTTTSANYSAYTSALPTLDVWYGSPQIFGNVGRAQEWVNILGNASDPDGIDSVTYSLNGGPDISLTVGSDQIRLQDTGDFNVEFSFDDLNVGANTVSVTATDSLGYQSTEAVTVDYAGGAFQPLDYSIDWSSVANIQDVAQVVDGLWALDGDTVRTLQFGYDRLVAIGDVLWDDYEVTVPITVNELDPRCAQVWCAGGGPIVGVLTRWLGHNFTGGTPNAGWFPMGALGAYKWTNSGSFMEIYRGQDGLVVEQDTSVTMPLGVPHMFKVRSETLPGSNRYSFKIWPQSDPEPAAWNYILDEPLSATANGSLLLVAHHVDASFGDVVVTSLVDTTPPAISNIQTTPTDTTATITWQTDETSTSSVAWGLTSAHELGTESDAGLVTSHAISLTGLDPDTTYHFAVTSVDNAGNPGVSGDLTFVTDSAQPPDTTPPVISNVQVAVTESTATVTWQTDEPAGSDVAYGPTSAYENGSTGGATLVTNHSVVLTGLTSDSTYHYQVGSTDGSGNGAATVDATFTTDAGPPPTTDVLSDEFDGPLDTDLWTFVDPLGDSSITTTGSQVAITVPGGKSHDAWSSYDFARIMQPVANNADFEIEVKFDSPVTAAYQIQGMLAEQDQYNLIRFDYYSTGYQTRLFVASFTNGTPSVRADAGVSGAVPLYLRVKREGSQWTVTYSSDGIAWSTLVSFSRGMTVNKVGVYAGNFRGDNNPPAHTAVIDYFRVTGAPPVVDTTPPVISNVQVSAITTSSATITWQTNEAADSAVAYGPTSAYEDGVTGSGAFVTSHSVTLTGLTDDSTYHYQVRSTDDDGNPAATGDLTFTTATVPPPDTTPPVISNVQVSAITTSSATITWQTDEAADSAVAYGPTSAYEDGVVGSGAFVTSHSVTLTGLTDDSTYHYQVRSTDDDGNPAATGDLTFTTAIIPPPDTTPPVISNIQVTSITASGATITWQTDEPADSAVAHGTTTAYENGSVSNASLVTSHAIALTGLGSATTYHFQISSSDGSGNPASSADLQFTTDTITVPPGSVVADDFSGELDTGLWTLHDPIGDSSVSTTGTQVAIVVPAGTSHDVWQSANNAPRLRQSVSNTDFEIEVKFDSPINQQYQLQGILVEQDNGNLVRFDFYSTNNNNRLFAATFSNGSPSVRNDVIVSTGAPMYMRIKRAGNVWTQSYSYDGLSWTTATSFTHSLQVNYVSLMGGNFASSGSAPAHTALIDYIHLVP